MKWRDGTAVLATPILDMTALAQSIASPGFAGARSTPAGSAQSIDDSPVTPMAVPSFDDVYTAHFAFVWRVLRTFGVSDAGIEDAAQDVFVVVHRRLPEFEGRSAITTWLFAIARRVAGAHRRKVRGTEQLDEQAPGTTDTFAAFSRAQAAATVMSILETMDEDKRIVFALVELEQLSVPEVARMLDLNLNTAYSRLRLARVAFELAVRARVTP